MQDLTLVSTEKFSAKQREQAQKIMVETSEVGRILRASATTKTEIVTPKSTQFLEDKTDTLARINALLKTCPDVFCYVILLNKIRIRISSIRPSKDGKSWHCLVMGEEQKGTAITIEAGGPLLVYVG